VDTNADFALNRNNGEYRMGGDLSDPNTGCRILAGRQSSTAFSSLNVSYINSPLWQTTDGVMNVPPVLVTPGMEFTLVQGIMTYSFSNMKLLPRNNADMGLLASVNETDKKGRFRIFPNPASEKAEFRFTQAAERSISIQNLMGQEVFAKKFTGENLNLSLSGFPSGLYQIRVEEKGNLIGVERLSIQH
jgi:hypothetical protein